MAGKIRAFCEIHAALGVLDTALDMIASRGQENDDRPRLLIRAMREALQSQRPVDDITAAWGALFGQSDELTGALRAISYSAQLTATLFTASMDKWITLVAIKARAAVETALVVAGERPEQAKAIADQAARSALEHARKL